MHTRGAGKYSPPPPSRNSLKLRGVVRGGGEFVWGISLGAFYVHNYRLDTLAISGTLRDTKSATVRPSRRLKRVAVVARAVTRNRDGEDTAGMKKNSFQTRRRPSRAFRTPGRASAPSYPPPPRDPEGRSIVSREKPPWLTLFLRSRCFEGAGWLHERKSGVTRFWAKAVGFDAWEN